MGTARWCCCPLWPHRRLGVAADPPYQQASAAARRGPHLRGPRRTRGTRHVAGGPDRQPAVPAAGTDRIPDPPQHSPAAPNPRPVAAGSSSRPATADRPHRAPSPHKAGPRRPHPRVPDRRLTAVHHNEVAGHSHIRVFEPHRVPPSTIPIWAHAPLRTGSAMRACMIARVVTGPVCAVTGLFGATSWHTDLVRSAASGSPVRSVAEGRADRARVERPGGWTASPGPASMGQPAFLPRDLPADGRMPFVVSQVFPPRGCLPGLTCLWPGHAAACKALAAPVVGVPGTDSPNLPR